MSSSLPLTIEITPTTVNPMPGASVFGAEDEKL